LKIKLNPKIKKFTPSVFLTIPNPHGHIQARKGTKSGVKLGKMELGKRWELKDYNV
jgi:hypothetical protein